MQIQVPTSVQGLKSATVRRWVKKVGERVRAGETLVELETEDTIIQVQAAADGVLARISANADKTLAVGGELGVFEAGAVSANAANGRSGDAPLQPEEAAGKLEGAPTKLDGVPIMMPQAGNTMEEGTVLKWRVKVGETIKVGQVICEVETDKATVEVEATEAGKVAWLAAEGSVVPVKQPIAILGEGAVSGPGAAGKAEASSKKQEARSPETEVGSQKLEVGSRELEVRSQKMEDGGRVKASPAARKVAGEKGIDLAAVGAGSGPGGRILSTDLGGGAGVKGGARAVAGAGAAKGTAAGVVAAVVAAGGKEIAAAGPMGALSGGRTALSKMRKAIAVNLQTSKQTVPHFYVKLTIDADPLLAFYRAQKPATGCTLNDVMLLAVGRVVGEYSAFRSRLEGNEFVETPAANIGVAVSVSDGLVVPVVLNVHALTLGQLAAEAKRVVEAARAGKIENMGKGVFTISNMGMLGVEDFSAIINPPESGILAISAVREAVIVKEGALRAGRVMSMTLSVDHRVVDGALAAQFMGRLRELLESPEKLLG